MLIDIGEENYYRIFQIEPHPFLSQKFLNLNRTKAEKIFWLVENNSKPQIGLITGLKDGYLISPFSAPFGGFNFNNELLYISVINFFLKELQSFIKIHEFKGIKIKLPPDIYHPSINSKIINCLFYSEFKIKYLDVTSWIDLETFKNWYKNHGPRKCLNQAIKNELNFTQTEHQKDKFEAYELIRMNRLRMGRPIYMTFNDLLRIEEIWNVDYFIVSDKNNKIVASAINYRVHNSIIYTVFWGDNESGRTQRAMDFCVFNLLNHYKQIGYKFLDIGISTENGLPNEGLLRFKELHEATSSLKYTFSWSNPIEPKVVPKTKNIVMEPINKYGIILRLVEVDDAEFILKLRTDPQLNKYISYTSPNLADQIQWIEIYKIKEKEGLEYYFIAQDEEGNRYGTVRLYNRGNNNFEIGSWLFSHNSPLGMAVKAHIIAYEVGFELFNAEYCKFEIRKENTAVLRYVEFFKPKIVSTDELNVYFQLTKENFYKNKNKIAAFSSGFKNKASNIYIHPTAEVQSKFIGDGTSIWQYCVVLKNARIGKNCNLNYNVFIENDVIIGDNVTVKSGVQLWDGIRLEDNSFISPNVTFTNDFKPRSKQYPEKFLETFVKEGASIGANSTIIGGITIGKYSMIGAGSIVTKNIPDYTLWYGNPATYKANICKCGQKLNDLLVCPACHTAYQSNNGIISEL